MNNKKIESLIKIGLKGIEAEIYLVLLREPDITAYKVAKIIKKPKTTIYKALEIMQKEGLIQCNQASQPITFSATKIKEYLDEKQKKFEKNRKLVEEELKYVETIPTNTGIFQITRLSQVFSKAIEILNKSEEIVLIACCHLDNPEIIEAIQKTAERGVKVFIQTYKIIPGLQGVEFVSSRYDEQYYKKISYSWLEIFSDGKEYLISLISKDDKHLYKAQWCNDPYTSILTFNANVGSFILTKTIELIAQKISHSEIKNIIKDDIQMYYKGIIMSTIEHLIDN